MVPGFIGNFLNKTLVTISAGSQTDVGNLTYLPPRNGPTVWEIGFPDRSAIGFYVPDPDPMYLNKLYINSPEKYRQYGLWDMYTYVYPKSDQVFTVGMNDPKKDWYFAQVDRKGAENYVPTTWQVKFNPNSVTTGTYQLRIAMAAAIRADLQVHINSLDGKYLVFHVSDLGMDNPLCRHGIHGLHRLFSVDVSSDLLLKGDNVMFLTLARGGDPLCGVLYDYIRLEAPATFRLEAPV